MYTRVKGLIQYKPAENNKFSQLNLHMQAPCIYGTRTSSPLSLDVLTTKDTKPSAAVMLTVKSDMFSISGASLLTWGPFYWHGLTLIQAWISNYIPSKLWVEIIHPFPNVNVCTVDVWEWISKFTPHLMIDVITYPCGDQINLTYSHQKVYHKQYITR